MFDCERHLLYCGTNCREFVFCEAFKELLQAVVGQGLCRLIFYKNLSQKNIFKNAPLLQGFQFWSIQII